MKKILLVTWYENHNYGTALQAYALKTIIEKPEITKLNLNTDTENVSCDFLPHKPVVIHNNSHKWKKALSISAYLMKAGQIMDKIEYKIKEKLFLRRDEAFKSFIKTNFNFASQQYIQKECELSKIALQYDYVVSGSDQIWNPESIDKTYFLEWVKPEKKFSYGSSLSVKSIPKEYEEFYRRALKEFKCISIRDSACCGQLSEIVGKKVVTVVDPVVLLGKDGLLEHAQNIDSKPFIFCYFLGNNKKHREFTVSVAKRHNLKINAIINVGNGYNSDRILEPYADWDADPWKFVSYINNSSLVISDSFHATVISVLLHKNFIVLEKDKNRPEQNNRILEFLHIAGLDERWGFESVDKDITPEQWIRADAAIKKMRQASMEYLMRALND